MVQDAPAVVKVQQICGAGGMDIHLKTKERQGGRAVAQPFRPVTDLQLQFCVHFFCFCRKAFPQEHGLAVGKMSGSDPMLRRKENVKKKCDIDLKKSDVE